MPDVVKECPVCKKEIEIDNINDIHDVARVKTKYYHSQCLKEYAKKLTQRQKHDAIWDDVVKSISFYEKDAKEILYKRYWQDKLNEHLKRHYDIQIMPKSFWELVADLHNGIYKGLSCKRISMNTLCGAWIWGQRKLDSINRKNKQNKKGPKTDLERLPYDLAILIQHIPDYIKYKAKLDAEEAERREKTKETARIDYNNVYVEPKKKEGIGDLSSILDDFF